MDLSTADSNKWLLLLKGQFEGKTSQDSTSSDNQLLGSIRQHHRRLTPIQVSDLIARYREGATVYELAVEFNCHRTTVAERLKGEGIVMRRQSPTAETVDAMIHSYESGLSLTEVGKQLGFSANTIRNWLRQRNIQLRDTHGRIR